MSHPWDYLNLDEWLHLLAHHPDYAKFNEKPINETESQSPSTHAKQEILYL